MKQSIRIKDLQCIRPSFCTKFQSIVEPKSIFYEQPGKCHYLLLSYISSLYKNQTIVITDAWHGLSSLSLSFEPSNTIHSFTQYSYMNTTISHQENIIVHENTNLLQADQLEKNKELLLNSAIILVDHSPHRGKDEYLLYEFLLENDYKGIVISDHVWIYKQMRDEYWYKILDKYRYDVTELGNEDGVTIYTFYPENQPFLLEKPDISHWTLVTAYFNLTTCPDASKKIIERNLNYYMHHSISTLSLPYNLVIYCDEESLPIIQEIRPKEFDSRTVYKIRKFDELTFESCPCVDTNHNYYGLTFSQYRDKINQNRREHPYKFDERNTASYYLFCMSRYLMLIETINENPFQSTHFAWINFCIERMGYKNLVHLPECLLTNRDKFSTCYIDYIPLWYIQNTALYYERGLANMCSGFFTGNAHYMRMTCKYIIEKFLYYLDLGYGHADEQLYSPVYYDHPELFDHYYGDYTEMITNYKYIYERPTEPIRNLIRNSFECGNYSRCLDACRFVLRSLGTNKCNLDDYYKGLLQYYFTESSMKLMVMEDDNNIYK